MSMRVVYIAGRFTGPNAWEIHRNVCRAESMALAVALAGAMPLCPHTNTQHFHGTLPDTFWYTGTLELLRRCDVVMLVPGWEESKGVAMELEEARRRKMPVFDRVEELKEWLVDEITFAKKGVR